MVPTTALGGCPDHLLSASVGQLIDAIPHNSGLSLGRRTILVQVTDHGRGFVEHDADDICLRYTSVTHAADRNAEVSCSICYDVTPRAGWLRNKGHLHPPFWN